MKHSQIPRPKWSLKTSFAGATGILLLVVLLVFLVETSIWHLLELMIGVLAFLVFVFLWAVLYQGVRYDKRERFHFQWVRTDHLGEFVDSVGHGVDTQGVFTSAGAEEGPLGCLFGLILDIVFSFLLVFLVAALLWVGVNVVIASVAAVAFPLFFIFSRSLRFVVARGRSCRGSLKRSLIYAATYAFLSIVWLYAILLLGRWLPSLPMILG